MLFNLYKVKHYFKSLMLFLLTTNGNSNESSHAITYVPHADACNYAWQLTLLRKDVVTRSAYYSTEVTQTLIVSQLQCGFPYHIKHFYTTVG